jgi:hypothetical protein
MIFPETIDYDQNGGQFAVLLRDNKGKYAGLTRWHSYPSAAVTAKKGAEGGYDAAIYSGGTYYREERAR